MPSIPELRQRLDGVPASPFLFVGSGFSRRYLGLETWAGLLRRFCEGIRPYEYYYSSANGVFPRTASVMASDFAAHWWDSPQYAEARSRHMERLGSTGTEASALKCAIADYLASTSPDTADHTVLADELTSLRSATIDGVITTNWDQLLEHLFQDYHVYVGQTRLLFSEPKGIAEIYKIHGCCSEPDSLVLTEDDYAAYNERNPYLAAKLLTIFVEHPVIFLGYSLGDENIVQILEAVASCLTTEQLTQLGDRLIFVQWDDKQPEPVVSPSVIAATGGRQIPITLVRTASFLPVFETLDSSRKFPARILRRLKEHIYTLVRTNDPTGRLFVQNIDGADDSSVDVVFGVGAIQQMSSTGYRMMKAMQLFRDVVYGQSSLDPELVLNQTLPAMLAGPRRIIPVFKYLREAGRIAEGEVDLSGLEERTAAIAQRTLQDFLPPQQYRSGTKADEISALGTCEAVVRERSPEEVAYYIANLALGPQDAITLRDLLRQNFDQLADGARHELVKSQFRKLACIYDLIEYGPGGRLDGAS